ncbi:type I-U CRISPR-associated protein Csb2 [Nocardia sp. NPDC127606]|uniref:type I-G CRISPR-associated protein Csb2 n=1 Tax=Nocardia sp. NPDC127606 TaxID=3345406 RepID=UPI00362BE21F
MPTVLALSFPFGRFHATPWTSQVNQAMVEIPPSPWRLLRTLYSVWQTRCPDLPSADIHGLLSALAELPERVYFPEHTMSHTRHYYPDTTTGTDRMFDAFAVFQRDGEIAFQWKDELPAAQKAALEKLALEIPYFGRADSVCTARVASTFEGAGHQEWEPLGIDKSLTSFRSVTSVLAPDQPLQIQELLRTPAEVRSTGLAIPLGSRLAPFGTLTDSHVSRPTARPPQADKLITAVRFDILQPALPPETDTVKLTDLLRRAAIRQCTNLTAGQPPQDSMIAGKDATGGQLENRGHAHYLPIIEDRRIVGLIAWAAGGFQPHEVQALKGLRQLSSGNPATSGRSLKVVLRAAAVGSLKDAYPQYERCTKTWESVTPYTPSHYRNRGTEEEYLHREIRRELNVAGITQPVDIQLISRPWTDWVRHRPSVQRNNRSGQGRADKPSTFVRLRFPENISPPSGGPITLGHLSHFGLGLFKPAD